MSKIPDLSKAVLDGTLEFEYGAPTESDLIVPTETIDITVTPEKSFNACLICKYFRNGCSGPDLAAATPERACEFLNDVRILRKLSLAYIARESLLSISTVRRILAGHEKNPSFYAIHRLCVVLVGDPNGKFPCALHLVEKETQEAISACKAATEELERYKAEVAAGNESVHAQYADMKQLVMFRGDQIREKDQQLHEKDKLLSERGKFLRRKDIAIRILSAALGISLLALIAVLVLWILALI